MPNLLKRILAALVLIPPLLWIIFGSSPLFVSGSAVFFGGLATREFIKISTGGGILRQVTGALLSAAVSISVMLAIKHPLVPILVISTIAPISMILNMFTSDTTKSNFHNSSLTTIGALYGGGLFGLIGLFPQLSDTGRWWIFLLIAATSINDTMAYTVGKLIGKHPLHKQLSPNKTIEGSLGGIAGSIGAVMAIIHFSPINLELSYAAILGILVGIFSQLGDLMESYIKRSFNVKDSGTLIPGHGGILDRCDGIMLGSPIIIAFLQL